MFRALPALALLIALSVDALGHDHGHDEKGAAEVQFHTNNGQWPSQVLYRALTPGGAVFVERGAFTHLLAQGGERSVHGRPGAVAEPLRMHAYQVRFVGATTTGHSGTNTLGHYANYFLGSDPEHWASGVPIHAGVALNDVYPSIDLRISGEHGLKYDWIVHPGADPEAIVLRFEGQQKLRLQHGVLHVSTTAGDVVEQRPVAWQEVHGRKEPVDVHYVLDGDRLSYGFPEGFDPRYRLVIDPVVTFCSYSGSSADNFGTTATYDEQGHLYGGGTVFNFGYPTTLGVVQPNFTGTGTDMGITKFTPDGTALVWSTYLGGANSEVPHSMVTNSAGELYILGTTGSSNFPTTIGCFDGTFAGGSFPAFLGSYGFSYDLGSDIVVTHLNASATALIGSTYVGGNGNDGLNEFTPLMRNYGDPFRGEIIMDELERPLIATSTSSSGLFTTPDAVQPTNAGGQDAYVFRMDPTLSTMLWATYYGGSGVDNGLGVQIAGNGDVFLTGGTASSNIPIAGSPFSPAPSGDVDGYIARFNASGDQLLAATYLGTTAFDQCYFVQLDTEDNVYVVGQTQGAFPVSAGVYANPNASQFIQKFTNDLSAEFWSTRIGGNGNENIAPSAFLVSICGQIYFSGWGGSTNPAGGGLSTSSTVGLPVSPDAFQPTTDGSDFYLIVLEQDAAALAYATFFGGSSAEHVDGGTSRFDKDGIVYQAVCAGCSGTFPTTPGAWSSTDMGQNCNLGVFKINFEQGVQAFIDVDADDLIACLETPFVFNATGNAQVYTWDFGDGSPQEQGATVAHIYPAEGVFNVMLVGTDAASCNGADTAFVVVNVVSPSAIVASFEAEPSGDCNGYSVELFNFSTGSTQFVWDLGDGTSSTSTNPVHAFAGPGTYEITLGVVDPICGDTTFTSLPVVLTTGSLTFQPVSPLALCNGESVILDAGAGYDSYTWSTGGTTQQIVVDAPGNYQVTVSEGACTGQATIEVLGTPAHPTIPDAVTCVSARIDLAPAFEVQQILWNTGATTPGITVEEAGIYWFTATDAFGCAVSDTVQVLIAEPGQGAVTIPNIFTPNNDGKNDTFQVFGLAFDDFRMEIYDRWGLKMFETTNPTNGWNGGLDNARSSAAPDGTYYYVIDLKDRCSTDPGTTRTGHVTLLR